MTGVLTILCIITLSFTLDTEWGYDSFQAKDPDGTITFVDIILHQLAELIFNKSWSDLSVENRTIETLADFDCV